MRVDGCGLRAKTFDFKEQLAWSHALDRAGVFDAYYREMFDHFDVEVNNHVDELDVQRCGIDKTLRIKFCTEDGWEQFTVDEKVDTHTTGNIFIELYTDVERDVKGWFYTSSADYIVYAFTNGRVFWIPLRSLRKAWESYDYPGQANAWVQQYGLRFVKNTTFTGAGVPVPADLVWSHCCHYTGWEYPGWASILYNDRPPRMRFDGSPYPPHVHNHKEVLLKYKGDKIGKSKGN